MEPLDAPALDMNPDADLDLGDGVGGDADGHRGVLRVDVVQGAEVEGTPSAAVDQLAVPLLDTRQLEGDHTPELADRHVHREPLSGSGGLGINLKSGRSRSNSPFQPGWVKVLVKLRAEKRFS